MRQQKFCTCGTALKRQKKYCSVECLYKYRVRPAGLKYKIVKENRGWFKDQGGWIDKKGYRRIKRGKFLHRVIMEEYLQRKLSLDEVIHHKDGNKLNNNINNLEVLQKREHDLIHMGRGVNNL